MRQSISIYWRFTCSEQRLFRWAAPNYQINKSILQNFNSIKRMKLTLKLTSLISILTSMMEHLPPNSTIREITVVLVSLGYHTEIVISLAECFIQVLLQSVYPSLKLPQWARDVLRTSVRRPYDVRWSGTKSVRPMDVQIWTSVGRPEMDVLWTSV